MAHYYLRYIERSYGYAFVQAECIEEAIWAFENSEYETEIDYIDSFELMYDDFERELPNGQMEALFYQEDLGEEFKKKYKETREFLDKQEDLFIHELPEYKREGMLKLEAIRIAREHFKENNS